MGDYLPGRSDLDLAAVVHGPLSAELREGVLAGMRHESLPCPARLLELVVYRLDTTRSGSTASGFELNLNTGRGTPLLVQSHGTAGDVGFHWFAIDRSVLSQAGVALDGPPAAEVFAPVTPRELMPALLESIRWHRERGPEGSDAVLNACRSLRFAIDERWSAKPAAGRWAVEHDFAPEDLVDRAIGARMGTTTLDRQEIAGFLAAVEARLRQVATHERP